jgi:hypothetical protein
VFIHKDPEGSINVVDVSWLSGDLDLDLTPFDSTCLGRLGPAEIAAAGAHVDAGSSAGIVVLDGQANRWT